MSDPLSSTHAPSRRLSDSDTTTTAIPFSKPTMLGRLRRSSSLSATDAQYHALPQSPDIAQDINIPSAIEEGGMAVEETDDSILDDEHIPPNAPVDSRIQWIHYMLGSAILLPWNVMITAEPYFLSQLQRSSIRGTFSSYLATTFTLSNFTFLAHATVTSKKVDPDKRTRWSMLCLALLTCLLTMSTFVHLSEGAFVTYTIGTGIVLAAAGAYLQTSVLAIASLFGPTVLQSLMSGQALVAVILSTLQLISATSSLHTSNAANAGPADGVAETKSARLFFGIAALFLFLCGVANAWMTRLPSFRVVVPIDEGEPWMRRRLSISADIRSPVIGAPHNNNSASDSKALWDRILGIAHRNITYEFAIAYVLMVTLSVYPTITISIVPTNPTTHPLLFSSLHFVVFNIGDWFGRYLCGIPWLLVWCARRLLALSLARTLFIPLFLACNVQRDVSSPSTSPIINSDMAYMVLLFAFGISNGYVSSMCQIAAPSLEHNPRLKGRKDDVDIAATIAGFCLVGGLVTGSIFSFIVRGIVCGCNPFSTE